MAALERRVEVEGGGEGSEFHCVATLPPSPKLGVCNSIYEDEWSCRGTIEANSRAIKI